MLPNPIPDLSYNRHKAEDTAVVEEAKPQTTTTVTKATQVGLEEFIEVATRATLRALNGRGTGGQVAGLEPQPLPPEAAALPEIRIIIGLIFE